MNMWFFFLFFLTLNLESLFFFFFLSITFNLAFGLDNDSIIIFYFASFHSHRLLSFLLSKKGGFRDWDNWNVYNNSLLFCSVKKSKCHFRITDAHSIAFFALQKFYLVFPFFFSFFSLLFVHSHLEKLTIMHFKYRFVDACFIFVVVFGFLHSTSLV